MTTPNTPSAVVTRFAPSPTGYLHVGGARTALFSWLLARHFGGRFLLRIEDTDLARSTEQATLQLLEDLRWLNLHWDNADLVYQSKRKDVYDALIADLISRGLAYKAYETREELDALRRQAEKEKRSFVYRRGPVSAEQASAYEAEGRQAVVRFAMAPIEHRFRDMVLDKEIVLPAEEAQDFVIRKADGMPTYHFAVVVDDAFMGITHVLRGQEHLKNTFFHMVLQEAMGYVRPVYGHLPIIENLDGSKMGKRDRDKKIRLATQLWVKNKKGTVARIADAARIELSRLDEWLADSKKQLDIDEQSAVMHVVGLKQSDLPEILVHDFRKNGYLPETLLNFLALLGWSPGGDRERMTMDEMVSLFTIDGIGKSNAKFDRIKLAAFNTEAVAAATPDRLVRATRDYLAVNPDSPLNGADDATLGKLIHMKKGFRLIGDLDESTRLFFVPDEQIAYDRGAIDKVLKKDNGLAVLRELRHVLDTVTNWTTAGLEGAVKGFGEQKGLGRGKVAQPIRVAISGTTVSPPIFESLEFLGRDRTLRRIDRCLSVASSPKDIDARDPLVMPVMAFYAGLILAATLFAMVEIQIEGGNGWAGQLPTWRIENRWTRLFFGRRPLTGYHFYVLLFVLLMVHAPYFLGMAVPSWRGEARILSFLILFWVLEDFLWFVFNPRFGVGKFRKQHIWWHAANWWWIMPRDYWIFVPVGLLLFYLSRA